MDGIIYPAEGKTKDIIYFYTDRDVNRLNGRAEWVPKPEYQPK